MTKPVDNSFLNRPNRVTPKTKRLYATSDTLLDELKARTAESFGTNTYEGKTEWFAVVLRNPETVMSVTPGSSAANVVRVKARIPEVHAHLPIPSSPHDHQIIDLYPEYVGGSHLNGITAGSLIRVNHQDRNHAQFRHENGVILEVLGGHSAFPAGYSQTIALCKEVAKSGVTPSQGAPKTGPNLAKAVSNKTPRKVGGTTDTAGVTAKDRKPNSAPNVPAKLTVPPADKEKPKCGKKSLMRRYAKGRSVGGSKAIPNRGDYNAFKSAVGQRESSNTYNKNRLYRTWLRKGKPTRKNGMSFFWGKYQMGHLARQDVGAHPALVPWNRFIQATLQEKFADRWWKLKYLEAMKYPSVKAAIEAGVTPHGEKIDLSGVMAMAHITGIWSVKVFVEKGLGAKDGLGTSNVTYLRKFYGYDVEGIKNNDWSNAKAAKEKAKNLGGKWSSKAKAGNWYPQTPRPYPGWSVST